LRYRLLRGYEGTLVLYYYFALLGLTIALTSIYLFYTSCILTGSALSIPVHNYFQQTLIATKNKTILNHYQPMSIGGVVPDQMKVKGITDLTAFPA